MAARLPPQLRGLSLYRDLCKKTKNEEIPTSVKLKIYLNQYIDFLAVRKIRVKWNFAKVSYSQTSFARMWRCTASVYHSYIDHPDGMSASFEMLGGAEMKAAITAICAEW